MPDYCLQHCRSSELQHFQKLSRDGTTLQCPRCPGIRTPSLHATCFNASYNGDSKAEFHSPSVECDRYATSLGKGHAHRTNSESGQIFTGQSPKKARAKESSQHFGVRFRPDLNKWVAEIRVAEWKSVDKKVWLGTFDTEEGAARAVDAARKLLKCGKKRAYNFPCESLTTYSEKIPAHLNVTDLQNDAMFKDVTLFVKRKAQEYAAGFCPSKTCVSISSDQVPTFTAFQTYTSPLPLQEEVSLHSQASFPYENSGKDALPGKVVIAEDHWHPTSQPTSLTSVSDGQWTSSSAGSSPDEHTSVLPNENRMHYNANQSSAFIVDTSDYSSRSSYYPSNVEEFIGDEGYSDGDWALQSKGLRSSQVACNGVLDYHSYNQELNQFDPPIETPIFSIYDMMNDDEVLINTFIMQSDTQECYQDRTSMGVRTQEMPCDSCNSVNNSTLLQNPSSSIEDSLMDWALQVTNTYGNSADYTLVC